jgi:hypothetical protein
MSSITKNQNLITDYKYLFTGEKGIHSTMKIDIDLVGDGVKKTIIDLKVVYDPIPIGQRECGIIACIDINNKAILKEDHISLIADSLNKVGLYMEEYYRRDAKI